MRNSVKLSAFAAVALMGGAIGLNCSKGSNPTSGDVKLAVVLPSGTTITTVNYQILSSTSAQLAAGSFNVSDPHATVSLDIVVPVTATGDAGDTVKLTATTDGTPSESCTGTSAPFPVVAGLNSPVSMTLTCGTGSQPKTTGTIGVTATLVEGDNCPSITSAVVGPDETSVGGQAMVDATAFDADVSETVSFAWAPAANFASPTAAKTTYTCLASGTQTFTLTVADSHVPSCTTTATMTIKCDSVSVCGNNVVELGEQCDPPNGTTCSATCQTIGGTGGAPATGGTTGTGGAAGAAGAPATGGVTGTGGIAATGGVTGTGGIAATGGVTGTGGTMTNIGDSVACNTCVFNQTQAQNCFNTAPDGHGNSVADTGCDVLTGTEKTNCLALLFCIQGAACQAAIHNATADFSETGLGFDNPLPCLCGTVGHDACIGSNSGPLTGNGVCLQQFLTASDGDVTGNFTNFNIAEGLAVNLTECDVDGACQSACGLGTNP